MRTLRTYDVARTHASFILRDIWRYQGLILGSPTYDMGLFPPMASLVNLLSEKRVTRKKLGIFFNLLPNFVPRQFIERMWSIQAFLHSDDSPDLRLSLHNGKAGLEVIPNTATAGIFSATYSKLAKLGRMFGAQFLNRYCSGNERF